MSSTEYEDSIEYKDPLRILQKLIKRCRNLKPFSSKVTEEKIVSKFQNLEEKNSYLRIFHEVSLPHDFLSLLILPQGVWTSFRASRLIHILDKNNNGISLLTTTTPNFKLRTFRSIEHSKLNMVLLNQYVVDISLRGDIDNYILASFLFSGTSICKICSFT